MNVLNLQEMPMKWAFCNGSWPQDNRSDVPHHMLLGTKNDQRIERQRAGFGHRERIDLDLGYFAHD
jgi:hypothetical protein